MMSRLVFLLVVLAVFVPSARGEESESEKFAAPRFHPHAQAVLRKYCTGCHNAQEAKGGLRLDDYSALLAGGKSGPALLAGKGDESLLIQSLVGAVELKMPPKGKPAPSAKEISLLRAWIDGGAMEGTRDVGGSDKTVPNIAPTKPPVLAVLSVAFSPKGDLIAVGTYREVRLVDPRTQHIVGRLQDHAGRITALRFNANGDRLLVASGEAGIRGQAKWWNVANRSLVRTLEGHSDSIDTADLAEDGSLLVTAGYDRSVIIWDVESGEIVHTLNGHNDPVFGVAFSPDTRLVASVSGDRTVKLWDVADALRLDTFSQSTRELYAVAFSPDGRRLAAAGADNRIRVWRISKTAAEGTNPLLHARFAHQAPILALAFRKDGAQLASAAEDRTVRLWRVDSMTETAALETQTDWAAALAYSPDGTQLLVGRHDGTMSFYDTKSGAKLTDLSPIDPPPPAPVLARISPPAIRHSEPTTVTLSGEHLAAVSELKTSHAGLSYELTPASGVDDSRILKLTADPQMPRGEYEISAVSAGGTSKPIKIHVDDLPQFVEDEPNDSPSQAQGISLTADGGDGAGFWGGLTQPGDVDYYFLELAAGKTLVAELSARSLGSKAHPALSLFDESGRLLAYDGGTRDPLLHYAVEKPGRYIVRVADLRASGSAEHHYRLTLGTFPFVVDLFPPALPQGSDGRLSLVGFNLPDESGVTVATETAGTVNAKLDPKQFRYRTLPQAQIVAGIEQVENEPNNTPSQAQPIEVPGAVSGRLYGADAPAQADVDLFRYTAKANQTWIIETQAAQRGSPLDTRIEVLHADGTAVERVLLQATRDSYVHFRGINADTPDIRLFNWEEMELNELLYLNGEVSKLFRMPQGPDSGFLIYNRQGRRIAEFDTTPTAHALEDPCYIVEPHPPGTALASTGLPIFTVYFENDDSADRKLGSDSRLAFTPPRDGEYLIRVSDVRGSGHPAGVYRLVVRRPVPDFQVQLGGANPTVAAGSGRQLNLTAERIDGFAGPIQIDFDGLPTGFHVAAPVVIEAGHFEASTVLVADPDAPVPAGDAAPVRVIATAKIDGATITRPINDLGRITLTEKPQLLVTLEPPEIVLAPGGSTTATLRVERNGFDEAVTFQIPNLPHGVIVDNIGLNGILLPKGQTQRQLFLVARPWVPPQSRIAFALAQAAGGQASKPITLHIRAEEQLAELPSSESAVPPAAP